MILVVTTFLRGSSYVKICNTPELRRRTLDDFCVAAGPSSKELAMKIAAETRSRVVNVESKIFPDGESYIRIAEEYLPHYTVLVQSTYPPQDRHIMQLCLMIERLQEMNTNVIAVVPYLAYARQHRAFLPGESISLKVLARMMEAAGASRVITVDIHNVEGLGYFSIPANSLSAVRDIAFYLKERISPENTLVVAPDHGAKIRAETLSVHLGTDFAVAKKERDRITGEVTVSLPEIEVVRNKNVIVIDDMISTGGTVSAIANILKGAHAKEVIVACTHALLTDDAMEILKKSGVNEFIATDTVPGEFSKVSVSHAISEFIRRL
ncbi:MAG: ribose-phosphate pyrophosphokinase [Conexivisphaerales archaeon]